MSLYRYRGPNAAVTLKVSDGKSDTADQDVLFWHDHEIELPADHDYVKVLVAKGHLTPVAATPEPIDLPAALPERAASAETSAMTDKPGKTDRPGKITR